MGQPAKARFQTREPSTWMVSLWFPVKHRVPTDPDEDVENNGSDQLSSIAYYV